MHADSGRLVTAVVTWRGEHLGAVGPFPVATPWRHDVRPVAAHLSAVLRVPVLVLRLVRAEGGDGDRGGSVTYHAEALRRPDGREFGATPAGAAGRPEPDGHPLRAAWATPDGLRAALDWARRELAGAGRPPAGDPEQIRSWNLSCLLRIPITGGAAWLKTTPAFGAPEAEVCRAVAAVDEGLVPAVLAAGRYRLLLADVPGEDCWGVPEDAMLDAVDRWAAVQARLAGPPEHRGRSGAPDLPDRSPATLPRRAERLLASGAVTELTADELARAHHLVGRLPALVEELAACGLPHTLLHGDFHPGNWRHHDGRTVVLDFSDACHGHPAFDGLRPRAFLPERRWADVRARWVAAWSALAPGSDPARALELARPLLHLHLALRYQEFLDGIEPGERIYHAGDPAAEIRAALAASVGGGEPPEA
ncbi:aminoglycoside phosphotransferase family protein [Kitasatospora sp. NPDC094015]|uniref:aminoglycoside phosphotransferase family protein n=1 Tax=Kitasatospora sp. NPDC094015 TaxID=3155205 RepID=UPI00332945BE